jgi:hypothetical protein
MLLQVFYSIRSERQLMERLEFDLLFRWFVGIGVDDAAWDHSTFPRTAIGCWKATSPPSCGAPSWPSLAGSGYSAWIISRSTAH